MSLVNCTYNELTLDYDEYSLHNYPTNINTSNINLCKLEKCKLINKLDENVEISLSKENNKYSITFNDNLSGFIKFNGIKYTLWNIFITKGTSHYYNNKSYQTVELSLELFSETFQKLLIIIPFKKSTTTSSDKTSQNFEKIFNEINKKFKNDTSTNFTSENNMKLNEILPDKQFFFYNVKDKINKNELNIITYSPEDSFKIEESYILNLLSDLECNELNNVYLKNNLDQIVLPIFYSNTPPLKDDVDGDDIYIDCKPVETQEPNKEYTTYFSDMINSVSGGNIKDIIIKILSYLLKMLFAAIVIGLIIYFPKLFESSDTNNNNNNNNNNIINNINKNGRKISANSRVLNPNNENNRRIINSMGKSIPQVKAVPV